MKEMEIARGLAAMARQHMADADLSGVELLLLSQGASCIDKLLSDVAIYKGKGLKYEKEVYELQEQLEKARGENIHGKRLLLIDMDSLKSKMREEDQPWNEDLPDMLVEIDDVLSSAYMDCIAVTHARWIGTEDKLTCSKCHMDAQVRTPFCPACGAVMDGGGGS